MIRLVNSSGGDTSKKFPESTLAPDTFLGRYYIGAFAGGSNYSGSFAHGLTNKFVRDHKVYARPNIAPGVNEDTGFYYQAGSHINLNGYGTCAIFHPNPTDVSYGIYLIGNSGTIYYYVDLYGDDGGGHFGNTTVVPV